MLKSWLKVLIVLKDGEIDVSCDQGVQIVFIDLDKHPDAKAPPDFKSLADKLDLN